MVSEQDPFDTKAPVEGLEYLGRAITDANGVPSGSPANYEALRGAGQQTIRDEDYRRIMADIHTEFEPFRAESQRLLEEAAERPIISNE